MSKPKKETMILGVDQVDKHSDVPSYLKEEQAKVGAAQISGD
jgi:hypothetical protein